MDIFNIPKYIETEFVVINNSPCPICGGSYITNDFFVSIENDSVFDIMSCMCENCGNSKDFKFLLHEIGETNSRYLM